ncbi:MAG: prolipoprotein diacylglyceryl transferase [Bdellovibrionota bacterium]
MFPVLFEIRGLPIHSYGFFIALGYVAALALLSYLAKKRGLDPASFLDIAFLALVSGVIGGRILFVFTNLAYFIRYPGEIGDFWQGGLVFYGGFIAAFFAITYYIRRKKLPYAESLDILAPALTLGHAFGRIGCFAAGCCYGSYCELPWGVHFHSDLVDPALRDLPLHPTQLYESVSLFLLSGALVYLVIKKKFRPGAVALLYVMAYSVIRSVIEIFRGDGIRGFIVGNWLSTSQGIAILLFLVGGYVFVRHVRSNN